MSATVSVVVPVFNGERFLAAALASAFQQSHQPAEVIVVDDGSTDRSCEIAQSVRGVQLISGTHSGVSAARNVGVQAANGEWIAFLDADDTWMPAKLARQVALGQAGGQLVVCKYRPVFHSGVPSWYSGPAENESADCFFPSAWLVRRDVFEKVGGFDSAWTHGEDFEWLSRAIAAGVGLQMAEDVLVNRGIHTGNASKDTDVRRMVLDLVRLRSRARAAAQ